MSAKKTSVKKPKRLTVKENKDNVNMLLLVYFSLFMLTALNLYFQYKG